MESPIEGNDSLARMQHLIDEMSASNHRIDLFSKKYDGEDAVGESASSDYQKRSSADRPFDALYDDAWRSEESDGAASLQEVPIHLYSNDPGDSGCEDIVNSAIAEVSNDFLSGVRQSTVQNLCVDSDESRISSDNDGKLLTGLASYARYPETATGLSDTDWNPYGTESDNNQSPRLQIQDIGSDSKSSAVTSFNPLLNSTDINSLTPNSPIKITSAIDERMSNILEQSERESTLNHELIPSCGVTVESLDSTVKPLYTPMTLKKKFDDNGLQHHKEKDFSSSKESISSNEDKKLVASTSSTGYSSATSGTKIEGGIHAPSAKPLSVIERAKLMGIPEDILLDKTSQRASTKEREFQSKYGLESCIEPDDLLSKQVKTLLSDTAHLSTYDKSSSVDYVVLQRDLQEIEDNLDSFSINAQGSLYGNKGRVGENNAKDLSDPDGEIIPSTTTTPEKKENLMWGLAGNVGALSDQQGSGLMREISLDMRPIGSQRPLKEKPQYNSDGNETRTSDSSATNDDHAATDLALAEMSEILHPSLRDLNSSTDVDRMLTTFQDKRRQLESRYQQLNNQGLAEKVFRILTNQDPESQVNGILSEVSAEEKDMRTKIALKAHEKNFNYSSTSSWLDDINQSFNPQCDVRKKLDLSGLSSVDSTLMFDKSATKGFSALDDARKLLSSQMMKASERTFNNSIEMRVPPQNIQCYPLYAASTNGNGSKEQAEGSRDNGMEKENEAENQRAVTVSSKESNQAPTEKVALHQDDHVVEEAARSNSSPNNSDPGTNSSVRPKDKYRPYRPAGSKEVYYTESDTASVADSVTTMESTHIGSDDAKGPSLPSHVLGSRRDPPNAGGIYSSRNLSTVREDTELTSLEEKTENNSQPQSKFSREERMRSPVDAAKRDRDFSLPIESSISSRPLRHADSSRQSSDERTIDFLDKKQFDMDVQQRATERKTSSSPTDGISAARREARWAYRAEEMSRGLTQNSDSLGTPARSRPGYDKTEFTESKPHRLFSSLDDFRDKGTNEEENEPLSLRIQMTYTDEHKLKENESSSRDKEFQRNQDRHREFMSDREQRRMMDRERYIRGDVYSFDRQYPELRPSSSSVPSDRQHVTATENLDSRDVRLSPAFQRALSPDPGSGLPHTNSDENLTLRKRDARLSPAFRRALSPELRIAIERRSPLLSQHIERSLAQPPSEYPAENRMNPEEGYDVTKKRPMFLARERRLSPHEYRSRPLNSESGRYSRGLQPRPRPRSASPVNDGPGSFRPRSPNGRRSPVNDGRDHFRPRSPNGRSPVTDGRDSFRPRSPNGRRDHHAAHLERVQDHAALNSRNRANSSPKRKVELTLERMSSESEADLEMDQEPLSKRAQLLKSALSNEMEPREDQDINAMWEKFQAMNDTSSSSINSTKLEAVSNLLKSPSRHLVSQYVKDREEYRIERQERAEVERERRLKEQQKQKHSSSEDEINERYVELLAMKEEERLKRRASKKRKGKTGGVVSGSEKKSEKDNLFSIPEDRSQEPSPSMSSVPSKQHKAKANRQAHMIDPNMLKLRERITKQKLKVDKEMLKEVRRIDKLKKLESLLLEKNGDKISNDTLQKHLEELSSTSAVVSDLSQENGKENHKTHPPFSDDSTTAKDSSAEMHAWKAEKERRQKEFELQKQSIEGRKNLKERRNHKYKSSQFVPNGQAPSPDISEIRLLKLVKEGYLTPDEAYKLAKDRLSQEAQESLNSSRDFSINSDNGKLHKFYSPYSRSSEHVSKTRHVPKLKFSGTIPHSSYGLEDFEQEERTSNWKMNEPGMPISDHRQGSKKGVERRPRSHSPSHGKNGGLIRGRHSSLSAPRRQSSASPSGRSDGAFGQHYSRKPKKSHSRKFKSENDSPVYKDRAMPESVAWHIPMDLPPSQWKEPQPKQPLQDVTSSVSNKTRKEKHVGTLPKEAEEFMKDRNREKGDGTSIWTKSNHPAGIPKLEWEDVVRREPLASKTNHWEVDPMKDRVQYILNRPDTAGLERDERLIGSQDYEKSLSKISLQEAFLSRKQGFISKSSERQKRLKLAKEDRQLQECLRLEREAIFAEQDRLAPPNLFAHPYSDNLYQPKLRILTKKEMKSLTAKRYNKLPEVVEKKEETKKQMEAKLNRLRANLFNKKVQRDALRKTLKQRC